MPAQLLSADELKAWLDQRRKFVLIDTGLADDFAGAHLPGAQNACVFNELPRSGALFAGIGNE